MLRRLPTFLHLRAPSSSFRPLCSSPSDEPQVVYSFLNPSLFSSPKQQTQRRPCPPPPPPLQRRQQPSLSSLASAISSGDPNAAWLSFRSLVSLSLFPSPDLSHSLISLLLSSRDLPNLKRALASAILLLRRSPHSLPTSSISSLFHALSLARAPSPALALASAALPSLPPFPSWGPLLLSLTTSCPSATPRLLSFLERTCRLATESRTHEVAPDLESFNLVLDSCCRELGSVEDADRVLKMMATCQVAPDARSFAALAYLYSWRSVAGRVSEVEEIVKGWAFTKRCFVRKGFVGGYVRSGDFQKVSDSVLLAMREWRDAGDEEWEGFGKEMFKEISKCFVAGGRIKELARMLIDSQQVESGIQGMPIKCSVGFGIMDACVELGCLDKAHSILDEISAQGASVGTSVYNPILSAYCKEGRTGEAVQLVNQIHAGGLQIDHANYDALIDASMSAQDFHSAFALFRSMREAGFLDLKTSYLTIMTGLMENHRPELMAGFLDSLIGEPRVEVATHDWNSIIHAFCKVGRLEDAMRTYRRMVFLQFESNEQTYLSLINGQVSAEKYFSVLLLWNEVKRKTDANFDNSLVDAFLYAFVKGGFFDAALEVIQKAQELKIFIDKWRYKHAFMENHKKLKMSRMRRKDHKKKEALLAFKNWAGLLHA